MHRLAALSVLLLLPSGALAQEKRPGREKLCAPRLLPVRVVRPTLEVWADAERTRQVGTVEAGQVYVRLESSRNMARVLWDAGMNPMHAWIDQRGLEPLPRRRIYLVTAGVHCGHLGERPGWLVAPTGDADQVTVGPGTTGMVFVAHAGMLQPLNSDRLLLATDPTDAGGKDPGARKVPPGGQGAGRRAVYPPRSPEAIALFEEAARAAGLPVEWARSEGLHELLDAESDGRVGRLNYTYGERERDPARWAEVHAELRRGVISAESSATGLGQLLLRNVERYYPSGRAGIGDPHEEAVGMLRYIQDRYGDPDRAWARYNSSHEGY